MKGAGSWPRVRNAVTMRKWQLVPDDRKFLPTSSAAIYRYGPGSNSLSPSLHPLLAGIERRKRECVEKFRRLKNEIIFFFPPLDKWQFVNWFNVIGEPSCWRYRTGRTWWMVLEEQILQAFSALMAAHLSTKYAAQIVDALVFLKIN